MKLYRNADGHFSATQDLAKARKRNGGGDFVAVEVPSVGREALADYLNNVVAEALETAPPATPSIIEALLPEAAAAAQPQPTFAPPVRPAPRLHPSVPTVDMMVDMIDRGDIDARGLSNLAESLAHRFERLAKEALA